MKTHETTIKKYNGTMKELARDIADLRYDALAELMNELGEAISEDVNKDRKKKRFLLSFKLNFVAYDLIETSKKVYRVWDNICKQYMNIEPELVKSKYGYWKDLYWREDGNRITVTWEYFNDNYDWCDKCKSYQKGQCMCYTR